MLAGCTGVIRTTSSAMSMTVRFVVVSSPVAAYPGSVATTVAPTITTTVAVCFDSCEACGECCQNRVGGSDLLLCDADVDDKVRDFFTICSRGIDDSCQSSCRLLKYSKYEIQLKSSSKS